jgi:hypothetical protein
MTIEQAINALDALFGEGWTKQNTSLLGAVLIADALHKLADNVSCIDVDVGAVASAIEELARAIGDKE